MRISPQLGSHATTLCDKYCSNHGNVFLILLWPREYVCIGSPTFFTHRQVRMREEEQIL